MANAFNLTAQLQLQAPKNTSQIANQISRQLNGIKADVDLKANPRQIASANKQMQGLSKATQQSANNMGNLNRSLSEAARRFSVITIATGSMLALARSIKNAFGDAIEFERELIKIEQVTGKSVKQLSALTKEITRLSTSLGASSKDLLGISRILTQAGFEINKVKSALDILAKTTLGATFEDIQDTTEGAVAVLRQFGDEARKTGGDIKFLEQTMDAINSVSKNFAVESGDLITVIRRVGGVFESAGGSVNELIALFTSVRATTRETAETIATGLRTIFTRIQRTDTVDQLKGLGIELRNSKGEFVGAYEAINRLSAGLSSLNPRDFRFSEIVESLGGFRQIGKVIPLIKQFTVAQDALRIAQNSSGSVAKDAATAQQSLGVQFERTKEKFEALVRNLADSSSFQTLARGVLKLADAFIKMVDALEPLLPLLLPLVGLKLGKALAPGLGALSGASKFATRNQGGPIRKFANGGVVPGTGSRDTVPAMLMPGEFVIRKRSVKDIGIDNLRAMNAKGYAKGGSISSLKGIKGGGTAVGTTSIYRKKGKEQEFVGLSKDHYRVVNPESRKVPIPKSVYEKLSKSGKGWEKWLLTKAGREAAGLPGLKEANISDPNYPIDYTAGNRLFDAKDKQFRNPVGKSLKEAVSKSLNFQLKKRFSRYQTNLSNQKISSRSPSLLGTKLSPGRDNFNVKPVTFLYPEIKTREGALSKSSFDKGKKKALGGLIQKFAAGGAVKSILDQNKVGAANLDVGKDTDVKLSATLAKVNSTKIVKDNNFLKNNAGVRKYLKSQGKSAVPSYTLKRKSLNEKTGNVFRSSIVSELVKGVDNASGALGQDLIGQSVKASDQAKQAIRNKFVSEGGVIGDIYESVLNTVANKGDFTPSSLFQPFDFPNGLQPPLVDNFSGVPNAFVDARKGQTSKDKGSFETKIANQIALEAAASEFGRAPSKEQKKMLGGMIKRYASGGGNNKDTVPALLTPGEFVFNKEAADRIGLAKLDKMNKQGVAEFNKGGSVGRVKRFSNGGRPSGSDLGLSGNRIDPNVFGGVFEGMNNVENALRKVGVSAETFSRIALKVEELLRSGSTEAEAFNIALGDLANSSDKAKKSTEQQVKAQAQLAANPTAGNTIASDENLKSAQNLGASLATRPGYGESGPATTKAFVGLAGENEEVRKQLEAVQKKEIQSILKEIRQRDQNVSISDAKARAERVVENKYGVLAKNMDRNAKIDSGLQKEKIKETRQLEQSNPDSSSEARVEGRSTGLARVQGVAQSAQNFVFLAGSASALLTQFTSLEEANKKALTQTIGSATALLGFTGTIVDLVASVAISTAARKAEAIASGEVVAAKKAEVISTLGSSNKLGKGFNSITSKIGGLTGPFIALAGAIVAVISVMSFFSNKYKAEAEELGKANDDYIKKLSQGKDFRAALQSGVRKQVAKGEQAQAYSTTGSATGIGVAAGGLAATIATFATIGTLGGPLGIALGAVVGTAVGLTTAFTLANSEAEALAKKHKEQRQVLDDVVGSYAELLNAQSKFKQELTDIDAATGLTAEQRVSRRLTSQERFSSDVVSENRNTQKAASTLLDLANETGKAVSALKESDFKDMPLNAQRFNFATKQMEEAQKAASAATVEAVKTLGEASALEIGGGDQTLTGLLSSGGPYAQAFNNLINSIKQETSTKRLSIAVERASIKERLKAASGEERATLINQDNALRKESTDLLQRQNQKIKDVTTGAENQIQSANKAAAAERQLAAAAEEAAQRMSSIIDFGNSLAVLDQRIGKFSKSVSDNASILSGGIEDFSFDEILGLKDLKRTGDASKFSTDLNELVRDLPVGMQQQGKAMVESVKKTAFLLQEGQVAVSKITFRPTEGKIGVKETRDLIKAAGLDPNAIPKNMFGQIQKGLQESFQDGINSKEFAEIFKPFIEEGKTAAKELEKINGLRNRELDHYAQYVDTVIDLRQQEVDNNLKSFELTKKADELRRRARGIDQTPGSIVRNRLRESRIRLSGTGARAGNLESILNTRSNAVSELSKSRARSARSLDDTSKRKEETRIQKELQKIISVTNRELEFFGETVVELAQEQEKLAEVQKERLNQEKAAKKGFIQDIVIGGAEERQSIVRTIRGIEMAFRSGTLQNQSPESRSAIVSMLDRFEDVFLSGAGMTGGQLRDLLIQQDAMRMGLPPEVAQALFSENNVQKDLIKSTDNLAMVMNLLARATLQTNEVNRAKLNPFQAGQQNKQFGGVIYRNEGGSIFQPKGTDTVPAMLTPGEFVVRKSAVDKVGVGTLHAINQGKPLYRANGGPIYRTFGSNKPEVYGVEAFKNDLNQGTNNVPKSNKQAKKQDNLNNMAGVQKARRGLESWGLGFIADMVDSMPQDEHGNRGMRGPFASARRPNAVKKAKKAYEERRKNFIDNRELSDVGEYKEGSFEKRGVSVADEAALRYFNNLHENILSGNTVFPYSPEDPFMGDYTKVGVGKIKEAYLKALARTSIEFPSYSTEIQEKYQAAFEKVASQRVPSGNIKIDPVDHWLSSFSITKGTFEDVRKGFDPSKIESDQGVKFAQNSNAKQQAAKDKGEADRKAKDLLAGRKADYEKSMKQQAEDIAEANRKMIAKQKGYIEDNQDRANEAVAESKAQRINNSNLEYGLGGPIDDKGQVMSSSGKTYDDVMKIRSDRMAEYNKQQAEKQRQEADAMKAAGIDPSATPSQQAQQQMERDQAKHDAKMAQITKDAETNAEKSLVNPGVLQYKVGNEVKSINAELMSTYYQSRNKFGDQNMGFAGANFKFYSKQDKQIKQAGIGIERIVGWGGEGGGESEKLAKFILDRDIAVMDAQNAVPASRGRKTVITKPWITGIGTAGPYNLQLKEIYKDDGKDASGDIKQVDVSTLDGTARHNYYVQALKQGASNKVLKLINPSAFPAAEKPKIVGPSAEEQARRDKFNAERKKNEQEAFGTTDFEDIDKANAERAKKVIKGPGKKGQTVSQHQKKKSQGRIDQAKQRSVEARRGEQGKSPQQQAQEQFQQRLDNFLEQMLFDGFDKMSMEQQNNYLYNKDPAGYGRLRSDRERSFQLTNALTQLHNYKNRQAIDNPDNPLYKAAGGSINGGMDSIPAMLTPGEFVMSREAVAKHGVGYMKNLNMGKVTGFRRGGVVGKGNVQYKANGGEVNGNGAMMIDPSLLSGVLDTFSQNFSANIDRIVGPMANLAASLENIANAFSGLTMTHVFSGEIGLAVNVSNKDAIIAAVSEGITPMISELITRQLDAQRNNFNAGG